jgi:hypothetical protein
MKFTVRADDIVTTPTERGEWKRRQLSLLGVDELDKQFCELNLHDGHPPVGAGKTVEVKVRKINSVFQGNARIEGDLLSIDGKAVTK